MTAVEPQTPQTNPEPAFSGALAAVKRRRKEIIELEGHLDLLVPAYEGTLKVRYRDLSDPEHDELAKKFEQARRVDTKKADREQGADILIKHCERIYVREGDGDWQLLEENNDPYRFDKRLGGLLELESNTAREVVLDVFSPVDDKGKRRHPDAIGQHVESIFAWRAGRRDDIDRQLLGE
jgi:hypothetical protein